MITNFVVWCGPCILQAKIRGVQLALPAKLVNVCSHPGPESLEISTSSSEDLHADQALNYLHQSQNFNQLETKKSSKTCIFG